MTRQLDRGIQSMFNDFIFYVTRRVMRDEYDRPNSYYLGKLHQECFDYFYDNQDILPALMGKFHASEHADLYINTRISSVNSDTEKAKSLNADRRQAYYGDLSYLDFYVRRQRKWRLASKRRKKSVCKESDLAGT